MNTEGLNVQTYDDVITAINMRINHIETGTVTHNAFDAKLYNDSLNMSDSRDRARVIPINPLSREQRDTIDRLEDARKFFQQESREDSPSDDDEDEAVSKRKSRIKDKKSKKKSR